MRSVILGGGIFGVTTALALYQEGWDVVLIDVGTIPHPLAATTDISKIIRLDYGTDGDYVALMEEAIDGWRRWNDELGASLFHETGVLFLRSKPLETGGFEYDSIQSLTARGHAVQLLDAAEIRSRYPAWNTDLYPFGYFNPVGGFARSGEVLAALVQRARDLGVHVRTGQGIFRPWLHSGRVLGVVSDRGEFVHSDIVVVAAGAWTGKLVPHIAQAFRTPGQPVVHFQPKDTRLFDADRFPVFAADISQTGYYGFPLHPNGVLKIANHGPGRMVDADDSVRHVLEHELKEIVEFAHNALPGLVDSAVVDTRLCLYCDSWDGHFWIAGDPDHSGLYVVAGGSGHGFKFAPTIGKLVLDCIAKKDTPYIKKFGWRPELRPPRIAEEARRQP
ncbi:MAG: FAD-dependent oxidoreductase [Myxococcales bacterium]|nr:FAD-dependent oxidoreductase [Myxococcales bacterium]